MTRISISPVVDLVIHNDYLTRSDIGDECKKLVARDFISRLGDIKDVIGDVAPEEIKIE